MISKLLWENSLFSYIKISTSNHMFGRIIWDKLHEWIFGNFEIALVKRGQFQSFQKSRG